MRYLLDTSFLITSVLGRDHLPKSSLYRLGSAHAALSVISVAELYEGPFHTTNPDAALIQLDEQIRDFPVLPVTTSICRRFAEVRAALRRRGLGRADFDLLIAATALHYDLTVLTHDLADFTGIPELRVATGKDL